MVFYVTLIAYLLGFFSVRQFRSFRALTGFGIGGEYAAINSAIDELIPAQLRGRTDIVVNGSCWLGAALGSGASLLFLDPAILPTNIGWRLGFALGGIVNYPGYFRACGRRGDNQTQKQNAY